MRGRSRVYLLCRQYFSRPCEVAIVIVLVAETDRSGVVAAAGVDGGHGNGESVHGNG